MLVSARFVKALPGAVPSSHSDDFRLGQVLVDQKDREIVELESLCALWEQGSLSDGGRAG